MTDEPMTMLAAFAVIAAVILLLPPYLIGRSKRTNKMPYRRWMKWSIRFAVLSYVVVMLLSMAMQKTVAWAYLRYMGVLPVLFIILPFAIVALYFIKERPLKE